jgi:hypothetical protein
MPGRIVEHPELLAPADELLEYFRCRWGDDNQRTDPEGEVIMSCRKCGEEWVVVSLDRRPSLAMATEMEGLDGVSLLGPHFGVGQRNALLSHGRSHTARPMMRRLGKPPQGKSWGGLSRRGKEPGEREE